MSMQKDGKDLGNIWRKYINEQFVKEFYNTIYIYSN